MKTTDVDRIIDWIVRRGLEGAEETDLLREFCEKCNAAGLPIGRALVVIGDKDLTDGLLARRAGGRFIKVLRKLDPGDRLSSRMANLFDNTCGPIAIFLWDALSRLSIRL